MSDTGRIYEEVHLAGRSFEAVAAHQRPKNKPSAHVAQKAAEASCYMNGKILFVIRFPRGSEIGVLAIYRP
jgi:hypothetical protein